MSFLFGFHCKFHKPPRDSWLVPRALTDNSVSLAPGMKLSRFGYEFEIPWTDLDDTKTRSHPDGTVFTFHSGLRLMIGASPAKLFLNELFKADEGRAEQSFGVHSDYDFLKVIFAFTPDEMHVWSPFSRVHYREIYVLTIKSAILFPESGTGFFNFGNDTLKGFQQGDPQGWLSNHQNRFRSTVFLELFSDQGDLSITILQNEYKNPRGLSQAEVNRIIKTVRRSQ
jgi:hypothetical protein